MLLACFTVLVCQAGVDATWTDAQARKVINEHKQGLRGSSKVTLRERVEAVDAIAQGSSKLFVKPLVTVVWRDPAATVRNAAAAALGRQPAKQARPAVLKLLRSSRIQDDPHVTARLVDSLNQVGYKSTDWPELERLFGRDFGAERVKLQQSILRIAKDNEELDSLDMLCLHLDEPRPVNVDDPSNPPAEYWERRWKAWQVWRDDVKAALFKITGHRFGSGAEARTWIKKNESKLVKRHRERQKAKQSK